MRSRDLRALAVETAAKSKSNFKVGAVVVKNGRVSAIAPNSRPCATRYTCAERLALAKSPRFGRWPDTVYVARILRVDGGLAIARPCAGCLGVLKAVGVKTVFYTTRQGWVREELCR